MQTSPLALFILLGLTASRANAEQLYAQSNLQLNKGQLTAINYRVGSTIPVGTVIKVLDKSKSEYECETADGVKFKFVAVKHIKDPIDKVFARFVSAEDPRPKLNKLSATDQALVKKNTVERGMSREAVLLAIGPPPSHKTPSLDSSTWNYWKSKFATFKVVFDDSGKVSAIPGLEQEPPPPAPVADMRFAITNVYALEGKVTWVNYLKGTMIPIGTKIEVTDIGDDEIEFKNAATGQEYTFENEKDKSGMTTSDLFARFFSKTQEDKLAKLDQKEQKKVKGAEVQKGMSKAAVLLAIGPPPPHETPSLDSSTWTYWKSRYDKMKISFDDDDKVATIE